MKTDMKIGILVGIVIVAILLIFFVQRGSNSDQPIVTVTVPSPPVQTQPPAPKPEPPAPPVQPTVTVAPKPQPKPEVILPVRTEPVELQPQPTPQPAPIVPQPEPIRQPRYHTVADGDSLSTISQAYYGSGRFWTEIQKANRQRIRNPNHLQVGWKLRIPYPDEIASTP